MIVFVACETEFIKKNSVVLLGRSGWWSRISFGVVSNGWSVGRFFLVRFPSAGAVGRIWLVLQVSFDFLVLFSAFSEVLYIVAGQSTSNTP